MGVTMLPGWYDQIAPYVQQLSGIIPRLINPHLDAQRQLQQQIIQNPQILQQLADIQANNPGALDKLGFGNISGYFSQFPESQKSKLEKEQAKAIAGLTPEQQKQRQANLAGVLTLEEMQQHGLNVKRLNQELVKNQQDISEGEQKRLQIERTQGLENQFAEWSKGQGKFNLYAKRRSGEVPDWMAQAITESPKISRQYDQDAQDYFREKELQLERERINAAKAGTRQSYQEWLQKSQQDQAERMAYRAGVENPSGFLTLIQNPQLATQIRNSTPEAIQMLRQNPEMSAAIDAVQAQSQVNEKQKQGIYNALRNAHTSAIIAADKFRNGKASDIEVNAAIDAYNQRVGEAQGAGIRAGLLKWGEDPNATRPGMIFGTNKDKRPRLMLVNPEDGSSLPGEQVGKFETPATLSDPKVKSDADNVIRDLRTKSPEERNRALQSIQAQAQTSPTAKAAFSYIKQELDKSGIQQTTTPKTKTEAPKSTPPKPQQKTSEDSLRSLPKGKLDASTMAKMVTDYFATKVKSERDDYLKEWQSTLDPADFARLKVMIGNK